MTATFFEAIRDAAADQDLDSAVRMVQEALGVETGDVASHWWDEDRREAWWTTDHDNHRARLLAQYAAHELQMLATWGLN